MKNIITTAALLLIPFTALAGGHSGLGGHGTGITVDSKVIEGKTGMLVQNMTNDVWIWDNPPEGFDAATNASCIQTISFAKGQEAPIGGTVTCTVVDETGDVFINTGTFGADGVLLTLVGGTGKWQAYTGAQWKGVTRHSLSGGSVYDFSPAN
tara:strand:+ start:154 stop:612 length:459 start_codon:yes stop_codon:yes gene_type:complete